jgi:hypothetical protein
VIFSAVGIQRYCKVVVTKYVHIPVIHIYILFQFSKGIGGIYGIIVVVMVT